MRFKRAFFGIAFTLLVLAGCNWMDKMKGGGKVADLPAEKPRAEQLVAYLNDRAYLIDTIQVQDLDLDAGREKGLGLAGIGFDGTLVCQRPHNFRLEGYAPGSRSLEADVGSNDKEFWFYIKQNTPPYLFHCSHTDVNKASLPFPFHPDWIVEALGMAVIPTTGNFHVNMDSRGDRIELVEATRSPQGQPVSKVTVFNRRNASGKTPQVVERKIVDSKGKLLFSAEIKEMQQDPRTGMAIPYKIVLHTDEMRLTMTLNTVTVNNPLDQSAMQTKFARPNYPGVQQFDLARRGVDPFHPSSDVRPIGSTFRGTRR